MDRLAASTSQPPPPPPGLPPPEPAVSEEINHWSMLADNMQSSSLRSFENIESYLSQDLLRVTAQNKGMYIALWTVDDVTGKDSLERPRGVFTASVGAFHMERPLKFQFTAFKRSFQVKCPHRLGLMVHSVIAINFIK